MDGLRWIAPGNAVIESCCRCGNRQRRWDRLGDLAYCADCQESIVMGLAKPFRARTDPHACLVCSRTGTLCYRTFPLDADRAIEMDLCAEHLAALLGRALRPRAYHQICRELQYLDLDPGNIFLLHDAFYDRRGRSLCPTKLAG